MKAFKALANRATYSLKRMFRQTDLTTGAQSTYLAKSNPYIEPHSRHRHIMPLYDLQPAIFLHTYIAPNVTIVGEVMVGSESVVWYGSVLRGDMNQIKIGNQCIIGENTVIHTAGSLPTGLAATVEIGNYVNIANNCTLYSCNISDDCYIGFKSIILEGARLEKGCAIGPNSVVPPGRIIPSGQLWAGNPVEYVRDLTKAEIQNNSHYIRQMISIAVEHEYEFLPYNSAYLQKENTLKDTHLEAEDYKDKTVTQEQWN
jgi:carbonic anhydrase/acetyltransferase-like protein (isoleucine patch superfamily)